jgi:hypothetical protein
VGGDASLRKEGQAKGKLLFNHMVSEDLIPWREHWRSNCSMKLVLSVARGCFVAPLL